MSSQVDAHTALEGGRGHRDDLQVTKPLPALREEGGAGASVLYRLHRPLTHNPHLQPSPPPPEPSGLSVQIRDQWHSSPQNTAQHRGSGPTGAAKGSGRPCNDRKADRLSP